MNVTSPGKGRFITVLLILLLISAAYFYFLSMPRNIGSERAVGGVLDLTGVDFERLRHGLYGEWEFYFGELLTPEDFTDGAVQVGSFIDVPSSWADVGNPPHGYATYRLVVKTDNDSQLIMMVPNIFASAKMWINGTQVLEVGTVGRTADESEFLARTAFVPFTPEGGQAEIVVQIANHVYFIAGMYYSLQIGEPDVLLWDVFLRRVLLGGFIGMLAAMSLYHLILFLHRRREWVYLAFSLVCFFAAVRFTLEANSLVSLLTHYGYVEWLWYVISLNFYNFSLIAFTHIVFKIPVTKARAWIYAVLAVAVTLNLILPINGVFMRNFYILLVLIIMNNISVIRSKQLRQNYYNYLYLIALIVFTIFPFIRLMLGDHLYVPAVAANLFLIMSQFFMLSVSYAEAKNAEHRFALENAALEGLSRMKTEYMANMSHETKTPLTVISVYVQLAAKLYEESDFKDEEISDSLDRAQAEIMRVSRMNDNTLRMASMQAGHERMAVLDTSELLKNSTEAYRNFIETRNNVLTVNIPENLPAVMGNADRLIQVVANLLTNSNKHTENGEIILDAVFEGDFIRVAIRDNGTGIDSELIPKVFERGVSGSGGTGFGLDICKNTIDAHNGEIWLESESGVGTKVIFTLPVHKE